MRHLSLALLVLVSTVAACSDKSAEDDDTDTDSDTDADSDTDSDLPITNAEASCGAGGSSELELTVPGSGIGVIDVRHTAVSEGCCPDSFEVTARVDEADGTITTTYNLGPDPCECICALDYEFRLNDVPPGTWMVVSEGLSELIDVE